MMPEEKVSARDKMEKVYFDLLETTHYSKITVSDIVQKAGVSRTTFYRHYIDIFDMHEKIVRRMSERIIEMCFTEIVFKNCRENYLKIVLDILRTQDKYIRLLLGINGSRFFLEFLYKSTVENFYPITKNLSVEEHFRLKFMTMGSIGIYVKDILDEREHTTVYIEICEKLLNFNKAEE